jgi:rRNA maturation endonuclease Nob1
MKKLLLSVVFPIVVSAQTVETVKPVTCAPIEIVAKELKKYKEVAVFTDYNLQNDKKSMVVLFRNEQTGTWTLVELQGEYACGLAFGVKKPGRSL